MNTTSSVFSLPPKEPDDLYWVGTYYDDEHSYFAITDGPRLCVVQTPKCIVDNGPLTCVHDAPTSNNALHELSRLHPLLPDLQFIPGHFATLVPRDGQDSLAYIRETTHAVCCDVWARLVDEGEITVTRWVDWRHWRGLWRGREVEVHVAGPTVEGAQEVGYITNGYKRMLECGHTLEFLGHVTRDGVIIGAMTERIRGRVMKWEDRSTVYAAVADIQQHGLIHHHLGHSTILMDADDEVIFISPEDTMLYPLDAASRLALDEQAYEYTHWGKLEFVFAELLVDPPWPMKDLGVYLFLMFCGTEAAPTVVPRTPQHTRALSARDGRRAVRADGGDGAYPLALWMQGRLRRWLKDGEAQLGERRKKGNRLVRRAAWDGRGRQLEGPVPDTHRALASSVMASSFLLWSTLDSGSASPSALAASASGSGPPPTAQSTSRSHNGGEKTKGKKKGKSQTAARRDPREVALEPGPEMQSQTFVWSLNDVIMT